MTNSHKFLLLDILILAGFSTFEILKFLKKLAWSNFVCHDGDDRDPLIDNDVDQDTDDKTLHHQNLVLARKCHRLSVSNMGLRTVAHSEHAKLHHMTHDLERLIMNP